MSTFQVGSLCEDCFTYGLQNYLKLFYINLEEQIIKCESSHCMFPYLKKSVQNLFPDSKQTDSILSLDEFLEEKAKQINLSPDKIERKSYKHEIDDIPIMYDFSALFMDNPVRAEDNVKTEICASTSARNLFKTEDVKPIKDEVLLQQRKSPPKARISRCLSNVKSSSNSKKSNLKKSKVQRGKNDPVLVIEPQSGKQMRPLDLIKLYMQGSNDKKWP